MSGPLHRTLQRSRAFETERDVEALDALARSALQQVVERRGNYRLLLLCGDVDQAEIGVARELGGRRLGDYPGEGLACIELSIGVLQLGQRVVHLAEVRAKAWRAPRPADA